MLSFLGSVLLCGRVQLKVLRGRKKHRWLKGREVRAGENFSSFFISFFFFFYQLATMLLDGMPTGCGVFTGVLLIVSNPTLSSCRHAALKHGDVGYLMRLLLVSTRSV